MVANDSSATFGGKLRGYGVVGIIVLANEGKETSTGWRDLVLVLPFTASAISGNIRCGEFDEPKGVTWEMILLGLEGGDEFAAGFVNVFEVL